MSALYIDSGLRGQGLGKGLVQATIQTAKDDAFSANVPSPFCTTSVRHGNDHALQLYMRIGFEIIDPDHHGEKDGRPYISTILRVGI
jgi:ribosomal protein S18 acetylase RimI-like enzyme